MTKQEQEEEGENVEPITYGFAVGKKLVERFGPPEIDHYITALM